MSLSPRLVAIQGIEFTPVQIAVQGLLDFIAQGGTTRRPKSTNRLKLQKISEGRAWLTHAKSETTSRALRSEGFVPPAVIAPTTSGESRLLGSKVSSKAKPLQAQATGVATLRTSTADTSTTTLRASAAAKVSLLGGHADTSSNEVQSSGFAVCGLFSTQVTCAAETVRARGVRNISDAEIVAALRVVDIGR